MQENKKATPTGWWGLARLRRHLKHMWPARWHFLGALLAGLVYSVSSGVGIPVVFKTVLPIFFGKESEASPAVVKFAKLWFGDHYQDKLLLTACIALPLVFLIRGASVFINRYLMSRVGFIALENLRVETFSRLQELPLAFYQQHKSGDLMSRLMNDTEQIRQVIVKVSGDIIKQPFTLLSAAGYLVYLSVTERSAMFTLIALASIPICVVPIRLAAKRLRKRSQQLAQASGDLTATVTETLQAPLEIQAYNLQSLQTARFTAEIREIFRLGMKTVFYQTFASPSVEFVSACGFVAALYFGVRTGMDFATFSSLALALFLCYDPGKQLSNFHAFFKMGEASLDRLENILDAEDTVPPPAVARPLPPPDAAIEFHDVTFRYATRSHDAPAALAMVSLRIQPGEVVALVGKSGAGKTTFAMLLPRFYDPTIGRVCCGGVDLRDLDKTAWRDRIAIVPQMPVLFNASVGDNIRMGKLSATKEEVRHAAQKAFLADFIDSLPHGYDTMVGERGAALSGGQRQRIAIARAFLKNAPILVLDEATSALDSESEAMVSQALAELMRGRTTIMIAHRFSSISLATRILVFEEGRITGDGTPKQLAETHPVYRRMVELQKLG
jgi:subfamily B ATP-binding cassette protein MsbA